MTTIDAFLTNCRLADGRLVDIGIAGGKIAVVGKDAAPALSNSAPALDIGGDLVLPGLVDGHMHLDKTLTGLPWMGHMAGPTRMSRIETDKTILPHLPLSTEERAGNLIRECVARGTSHLRTHVDIDLESGLAKLEGVLAARERYRDRASTGNGCSRKVTSRPACISSRPDSCRSAAAESPTKMSDRAASSARWA
jgi:cytosine/creatinine deaminase